MEGHIANPELHSDPIPTIPDNLVGDANEVQGSIAGINCTALVDTGSQVTSVSQKFYLDHLSTLKLHDCTDLLRIEGAGGHSIPYAGYIFAEIGLKGVKAVEVPVLVVKDTAYNNTVPILVGTNCLQRMQYHQCAKIPHVVQLAKQSVEVVQRHLEKSGGVYGIVYASADVSIRAGHMQVLCGETRIAVPIPSGITMVAPPRHSALEVTPCLLNIDRSTNTALVEVLNSGEDSLQIKKGEKIAELHQVTVDPPSDAQVTEDGEFLTHSGGSRNF